MGKKSKSKKSIIKVKNKKSAISNWEKKTEKQLGITGKAKSSNLQRPRKLKKP